MLNPWGIYFELYQIGIKRKGTSNMKTIVKWIADRSIEPSSWAAGAAALVGVSILVDNSYITCAGIAVAAISIVLRERGLI